MDDFLLPYATQIHGGMYPKVWSGLIPNHDGTRGGLSLGRYLLSELTLGNFLQNNLFYIKLLHK